MPYSPKNMVIVFNILESVGTFILWIR